MAMSKKDFIELADIIKDHNRIHGQFADDFNAKHLDTLARFCAGVNPNFMRERWLDYIAGKCGQNGGTVKTVSKERSHAANCGQRHGSECSCGAFEHNLRVMGGAK